LRTSLCTKFVGNIFSGKYDPTIEEETDYTFMVDGVSVRLRILDTAGQEEYHALMDQWLGFGNSFLVV
jgi:GTPase SAR1 family protein